MKWFENAVSIDGGEEGNKWVSVCTTDQYYGGYGYYVHEELNTGAEVEAFIQHIRNEAKKAGLLKE